MKDAQFISELLLLLIEGRQIGFDQETLDAAYGKYEDLEELDPPVDPEEVKERLQSAKEYLLGMETANECVKEYAGTLAAFYTLWAAVTLHRVALPVAPADFARAFAEFREMVNRFESEEDKAALLNGADAVKFKRAAEFLAGYRGASTDLTPRVKRLAALLGFIRGE
jgi:hypothetical protein